MKDFERIDQLTKDYDKLRSAIISQKDRLNKLSKSVDDPSFQCACIITELSLMNILFEMTGKKEKQQLDAEQANQQPDANTAFLMKSAEKAEAEAANERSQTMLNTAKVEKTQAETKVLLSGGNNSN